MSEFDSVKRLNEYEEEIDSVEIQSVQDFAASVKDLDLQVLSVMREVINVEISARTEN